MLVPMHKSTPLEGVFKLRYLVILQLWGFSLVLNHCSVSHPTLMCPSLYIFPQAPSPSKIALNHVAIVFKYRKNHHRDHFQQLLYNCPIGPSRHRKSLASPLPPLGRQVKSILSWKGEKCTQGIILIWQAEFVNQRYVRGIHLPHKIPEAQGDHMS